MNLKVRRVGSVAIVDLGGRIVLGESLFAFRDAIRDVLNDGFRRIVLNMEGVTYMDSSGIGELVTCYTTVSAQGGTVKLLNPGQKVGGLLNMTKLLTVFETCRSEEDAVASFDR